MTRDKLLARYGTALAAAILFAGFSITADNFLAPANLIGIVKQTGTIVILGVGFTLALIGGELDLSFANVATLAAIATGTLVQRGHAPSLAVGCGLSTGLGAGVLNGLIVTRLKVPSLIATLATASIANGLAFWLTDGVSIVGRWPVAFTALGRGTLAGLPAMVWWTAGIVVAAQFFLKETRLGFRLVCTGEAEAAASLAGVPVRGIKLLGLALSGLCAGIAAVLLAASLSSAAPGLAADDLLIAIAGVMLGMTMIEPGRPNIPGTCIGALTIGMLSNGLVLLGAPYYVQDICLGLIIIASVSLSASVLTRAAFHV